MDGVTVGAFFPFSIQRLHMVEGKSRFRLFDGHHQCVVEAEPESLTFDVVISKELRRMRGGKSYDTDVPYIQQAAELFRKGRLWVGPGDAELMQAYWMANPDPQAMLLCMADVESRSIAWLWPGRIPLGRITLLVGRPGEGKSFLTTDMAARITTGMPWPDGSECPQGSVLLICAEDDPCDTIRPRLDAHGADVSKVDILHMVRRGTADGKIMDSAFTLADVVALESALAAKRDYKLIVVDPIGSYLGGMVDANQDNKVRSVLAPVAKLADQYGVAVLVVAHRRKSSGGSADELAMGSRAFTGIARAVWHLTRDPQDKSRRLLLPGKNNLSHEGSGLAFVIEGSPARLTWEEGAVDMSADDALAAENEGPEGKPGPKPVLGEQATDWLKELLSDSQPRPVKAIREAATDAGLNWRTVQAASRKLGVIIGRISFEKGGSWRLA